MNRNIKDVKKFVLNKKIYIILITMILIAMGVSYNLMNIKYVSSQKLLIGKEDTNLIDTYKEFIKGSSLLEEVKNNVSFDISVSDLSNMIEVAKIDNTNMIEITVYGEEAEEVDQIADEISKVFVTTVDNIYGDTEIYKVDTTASYYTKGNTIIIGIISGIVGIVGSSAFFAICFIANTKLRSCKDIETITGLKALIAIPKVKQIARKKVTLENLRSHKSKIFKVLMTNIQFVNTNDLKSKSILITSPNEMDGKTYVSLNLAVEFAKAGKKVIVIDGDMRNGKIAKIFNLPTDFGFSNYLSNLDTNGNYINETITRFINDTEIKNLNVITSGIIPPNPAELLKEDKINELMKDLKVFYDIIIIDTVSILGNGEAKKLAKLCDLTLMLSTYNKTKKDDLLIAYDQLNYFEGACIGVGINKVPEGKVKRKNSKINRKEEIKEVFEKLSKNIKNILDIAKKKISKLVMKVKNKSKDVKEFIQTHRLRKEEIKLIEAAQNPENNNIIEKVFESKTASPKEEVTNKEENVQLEITEQVFEKEDKEEKKIKKVETTEVEKKKVEKEKEEQEKIHQEKLEKALEMARQNREKKALMQKQQEKQEKKEIEKKHTKQTKVERKPKYEPVDFVNQPVITEEMVRKQVEMDEMIRIAEQEEEEEKKEQKRLKSDKRIEFYKSIQDRIKNIYNRPKLSETERLNREKEKLERKVKMLKERQEKKAQKELQKQKEKEQMRINIEIHDDNIYPRPRM